MSSLVKKAGVAVLAAAVILPLAVIGIQMSEEPGLDQPGVPVADHAAQMERGRYLALAGDCMACHTARGGAAYAGARAIRTPFGDIYSSNITPDRDTGIGTWTADTFWRALHAGKRRDGSFLYPAFPYPNFTAVTRADSDALFAYLQTIAPAKQENRPHALRFPYNHRILLAFWRTLYFKPGVYRADSAKSEEWNRGAYLVQGLGHCNACHTSRNALGGTDAATDLAGGMIPMLGWYASSLTSDQKTGLENWHVEDVADMLESGTSQRGAAFGPMAEVVGKSLQHLSRGDLTAMATYLKSMPGDVHVEPKPETVSVPLDTSALLKRGETLYGKHCAECHQADGKGAPPAYPPLADNRTLAELSSVNAIRIVLSGGFPPVTAKNPRPYGMPPFGAELGDADIAAVVSYIRTAWGNRGTPVSSVEVARFRGSPAD